MTSPEIETLRVNSVSALLALVPYTLRHQPTTGTAVLMVFNPQGTFVVGVRGAFDDLDEATFVDTVLKGTPGWREPRAGDRLRRQPGRRDRHPAPGLRLGARGGRAP